MQDIYIKLQQLFEQQQILQQHYDSGNRKQNKQCIIPLPELEIPIFDGNKINWREFWDIFQTTIDQNKQLSDTEKFCYLKSRVDGDAKEAISGLLLSTENYEIAKGLLKERFGNDQWIINFHLSQLINLQPALNSPKGLHLFYDKLESHLRGLEALRQDINHEIFALLITSKLPKDILVQLIIQRGVRKKWSVALLRELLKNYICVVEEVEQLSDPGNVQHETEWVEPLQELPHQRFSQSKRQTVHQRLFKRCRYCRGNHWSDQCVDYFTSEDRKLQIKDSCFLCLKPGHIAFKCLSNKRCYHCGRTRHHHRSLCPEKFTKSTEKENAAFSANMVTDKVITDVQSIIEEKSHETSNNFHHETELQKEEQLVTNSIQNDDKHEQIRELKEQLDQVKSELAESKVIIMEMKGISSNTDIQQSNKQIINEPDIDFRRDAHKETVQCINAKSPNHQINDSVQEGCEQTTMCTEATVTDLCSQHNINRNICDHLKGAYTRHLKHQNCIQHFSLWWECREFPTNLSSY